MTQSQSKSVQSSSSLVTSTKTTTSDNQSSFEQFHPYISEIRKKGAIILIFFLVGGITGAVYYQPIVTALMSLFNLEGISIVLTSPYQFIEIALKVGFFTGTLSALPVCLYFLLQFIRPGLSAKEFRLLIQLLPVSVTLFFVGFAFGIWIIQYVIDIFSRTTTSFDISNIWDLSGFLGQIIATSLSLALVFQLPMIMTALFKLNVVTIEAVKAQRRIVYVVLLILGALITPPDIGSLAFATLIPIFLFECTLLLNRKY